jgi:hypothetical protein
MATVEPGLPALIQDDWYVTFSPKWNASLINSQNPKAIFQVVARNQIPYDLPYIIQANDYRDVDFSNTSTLPGMQENLYPTQKQTLYEIQMGFKEANFLAQFYVPAGQNLSRLEQTTMVAPDPPTIVAGNFASPLRYLGQRKWCDSPYEDKKIYIYTIAGMDALIMRLFVDSGLPVIATDYEKIIVGLVINKCRLVEVTAPTSKMTEAAKTIPSYLDLRW